MSKIVHNFCKFKTKSGNTGFMLKKDTSLFRKNTSHNANYTKVRKTLNKPF